MSESGTLYQKATDMLREMGIPLHFRGFHFIRDAIILVSKNDQTIDTTHRGLYPLIARKYKTATYLVAIEIGYCIDFACNQGNTTLIYHLFGQGIRQRRIKNMEFIATIATQVNTEHAQTRNGLLATKETTA